MAKAKILADTISITSEVLTDENIRKVEILAPSVLRLTDLDTDGMESTLYQIVTNDECNSFTKFGAVFKGGKTVGHFESDPNETTEEREKSIKLILTAVLGRINAIEQQVKEYLEDAPSYDDDIEFLD